MQLISSISIARTRQEQAISGDGAIPPGVAILSRHPMKTIAKALVGDDSDSHARFLEVIIKGIRIVNIYLPNGNPVVVTSLRTS